MIAVGYLRCSTDKQERSAAEQWGEIRKYCTKRGYTLLPEPYVDEGWSGDDPDRPDFNRLLRDCSSRACPFDVIVVFDQGRFSRSDTDTATVIFVLLRDSDIRLESVTEGVIVDPNSQDELSQSLSRAVNQYAKNKFLKDLAYSVARSRVSLAKRGVFGGPPPYGTRTRSDGRLERDPPKARIVQLIFRWLLSGWTLNAIVRRLNTEGVPSPWKERIGRGKWSSAAIKLILRNPVYYGHRVFGRTRRGRHVTIDGDSLVPVPRQMQGKKRKGTAGIVPEVPVWSGKPIVDVHSWQEAQKIVDAPSKKNLRNTRSLPLVGIARCGFCGSRMFSQRCKRAEGKGRPAKTWTYYRCPNTSGSSSVTPDHQHDFCGIPADVLWSATVRAVEEYLSDERIADVCKEVDRSLRSARSHERQSRAGTEETHFPNREASRDSQAEYALRGWPRSGGCVCPRAGGADPRASRLACGTCGFRCDAVRGRQR